MNLVLAADSTKQSFDNLYGKASKVFVFQSVDYLFNIGELTDLLVIYAG
jgi:hypothetical protein